MAGFTSVLPALAQGASIRRDEWEPIIRMFVLSETLMCQCGAARPWRYSLSWDEIVATDWQLIKNVSAAQPAFALQ